ncbi:MAG: inosine/guanosine kinase [Oligoflexia bacterium]|nr:inosine/guanosine kinase [Oligoflexia bacterium]
MRFPGKRKSKHYFPVTQKSRISFDYDFSRKGAVHVIGIDQLLVDIEAQVDDKFLLEKGLPKGQSIVLDDAKGEELYQYLKKNNMVTGEYPGGAVGNTLHNYSVISDSKSILLGVINKNITVGDYAYKYICNTCSLVDLSYLQPCIDGQMGKAICFVTPDGERTFGICVGRMNDLSSESISETLIKEASILLISAYLLRSDKTPLFHSTMKAVQLAQQNDIPVVLSLGTEFLIRDKRDFFIDFIKQYVNVLAMNDSEAKALSMKDDTLLAGEWCLDIADMALITVGPHGLYLAAYTDKKYARETKNQLHTKSIVMYNKHEYSRGMSRKHCDEPIKIYTHINPFLGGPGQVASTNGAGDAALAALIHDISANVYHKDMIPNSPKHAAKFLTYSSLAQISKYANRVSYEVLEQNSPRLLKGLPEKEDNLEEGYWEK